MSRKIPPLFGQTDQCIPAFPLLQIGKPIPLQFADRRVDRLPADPCQSEYVALKALSFLLAKDIQNIQDSIRNAYFYSCFIPYAYKLIRKLNEELKAKGFITIAGRVNRQYFYERLYGAGKEKE